MGKTIYDIVKKFLQEMLYPFMENDKEYKEEVDTILKIILFDFEEKEKAANNLKNIKNLRRQETLRNIQEIKLVQENQDLNFDNIYD